MFTGMHQQATVLYLRPLEWTDSTSPLEPLAMLWHPVCVAVGYDNLCFRGLEAVPRERGRRWAAQKWACEVLSHQQARARLEPDKRYGELKAWAPPAPPTPG
jgi:hypothetical protein